MHRRAMLSNLGPGRVGPPLRPLTVLLPRLDTQGRGSETCGILLVIGSYYKYPQLVSSSMLVFRVAGVTLTAVSTLSHVMTN